jgi:hypothetical protein
MPPIKDEYGRRQRKGVYYIVQAPVGRRKVAFQAIFLNRHLL